ncbi:hypothetical protein [Oceaniglobus trochenteri]|uniref:hypothetical protein n=1 Tax=Oceaniglobus trochenteri TaxID=2763260 RepID=UPI001CFF91E6|nr:hypothetical protein [Oceaniglobus trochenteri]
MTPSAIETSAARGARNLLVACAGARAGQRLLILRESPDFGYYEPGLAECVGAMARRLGLEVTMVDVGFSPENPGLSPRLRALIEGADITLFLSRLGDQLRFAEGLPEGRIVVCFVIGEGCLGSAFGTADYRAFVALKSLVNRHLAEAQQVRVTCRAGTDFSGRPEMGDFADTSVKRFPVSVFAPVPGEAFSGTVALPGFLAGTGSRYYDGYMQRFDGPVLARFRAGRLTGFDGSARDVARAQAQYDRVARRYGIDRDRVHSWHAGIHPGCGFPWDATRQMERWSGAAFGNPRILHLHTCGDQAPGEISLNVIDPTVIIDGVKVWEDGVFHPERLSGGGTILRAWPMVAELFANPDRRIGMAPPSAAVPAGETASTG